ncbi:multiheme c-type cytochrome [Ruegeria sp. 2205SS24-7]|uniref:multiheme c-type cytochrome n=1 Tax=Ruegeria discodermiae TaxID=3064389 RepID=UPI002740B23C|nr:multiheme c-type cytochrome [Ruegeria sp. 2205SS24-7]MDP5218452.1 multiheme c-type cytochrome [Ruegeria sp. 2205SS24-7]
MGLATVSAAQEPAYVGSSECTECHVEAAAAWSGSHHALAWTAPSPDTVIADFEDTSFIHDGMSVQFSADENQYRATVTEKDGVTTEYPVHSVVGIAPLQQYLLETEPGRLQSFDVVWDTEKERWYHLYPDQDLPPDDGLHWTGPYKNWNARCAACHATGLEKNYDPDTRTYASTHAEIGVGCEACHGPGSAHLDWAAGNEIANDRGLLNAFGLTMDFNAGAEATIQQCATCHSRREAFGDGNPLPGTPYHDNYNLALLRPGLYHADGQILDEVYVYGSFLQSKMYASGVSCTNCHEAHSATLIADGNEVCTQCHSPAGREDFPGLTLALYDDPSHHFHTMGSEGAACKNCHMPERIYMGIDGRRDHGFRIPRPDLAAETGAPDTCTDCHSDRTAEWAAQTLEAWYPQSVNRGAHFGQMFAAARTDPVAAGDDLAWLAREVTQPAIIRATALWLLQQSAAQRVRDVAVGLLDDPDPMVRASAVGLLTNAGPDEIARMLPLLQDPLRVVRIAAARAILSAGGTQISRDGQESLRQALSEWRSSLVNRADFPETHLVLGGMALTMRNLPAAQKAFEEVTLLDPQRVDAWVMQVRLAAATVGSNAARLVLDRALSFNPDDPSLSALASDLQ